MTKVVNGRAPVVTQAESGVGRVSGLTDFSQHVTFVVCVYIAKQPSFFFKLNFGLNTHRTAQLSIFFFFFFLLFFFFFWGGLQRWGYMLLDPPSKIFTKERKKN